MKYILSLLLWNDYVYLFCLFLYFSGVHNVIHIFKKSRNSGDYLFQIPGFLESKKQLGSWDPGIPYPGIVFPTLNALRITLIIIAHCQATWSVPKSVSSRNRESTFPYASILRVQARTWYIHPSIYKTGLRFQYRTSYVDVSLIGLPRVVPPTSPTCGFK